MMFLGNALLALAVTGVVTSTGYLVLLLIATRRFHTQGMQVASRDRQVPAATVMKPLCGSEPMLEQNLETFFVQDHPNFELIFGTRDASDPALDVVHCLKARYPSVPVRIVFSGEPDQPNAKVCTLREMFAVASHECVVISDSDVGVGPDYLRRVVRPLQDDNIGLVMCLYRGVPTGGFWAGLEALGMSVEMTAGVVAAATVGEVDFALGPTMATRREVVKNVGGIGVLAEYCADDYVLGNLVAKSGKSVVISEEVINHYVLNSSFLSSMLHQARWMKSTRFSIPSGHASSVMTFAVPYGILAGVAGWFTGHAAFGAALFGWTLMNRMLMSVAVGWGVVRDSRALRYCWLYPLRDLMGFGFWLASYTGNTVDWRGERYNLVPGGRMVRQDETPGDNSESVVVRVDKLS